MMGNEPRIIAGSCRSGTTWILDVLAETNDLRTVFEPLHPQAVCEAKKYSSRLVSADTKEHELEVFFDRMFSGDYHSIWTDYRIRPRRLMPDWKSFISPGNAYALFLEWKAAIARYQKYSKSVKKKSVLIKVIRANLMLGWLKKNFNAKIVYIIRHPGAVVESKMRIGGVSWDPEPVLEFYRDESVLGNHAQRYRTLLSEDLSPAESHALIWCIENQLPLEQSVNMGFPSVYYENLRSDGESEWGRIVSELSLENNPYSSKLIDRPSQQASSDASKQRNGGGKSWWYERINTNDLDGVARILSEVGITTYSAYDPMPVPVDKISRKYE